MLAEAIHGADEPSNATRELLLRSAPMMFEWSRGNCARKERGGMEEWAKSAGETGSNEAIACDWYHGTWQLLRLLNMVAVPPWYSFYEETLSSVLRAKPRARVLIAACADYGMLATLHAAIIASQAVPSIIVVDICETPLKACRWYAAQFGFDIECRRGNLLAACDTDGDDFDLIITDEFLTVIKNDDKPVIAQRWKQMLRPGGSLVTTAMIGGMTTAQLRESYSQRAAGLWRENSDVVRRLGIDPAELIRASTRFAELHNRYMLAHESELADIFHGFEYSCTRTATPGECVNPTSSLQIVARSADRARSEVLL